MWVRMILSSGVVVEFSSKLDQCPVEWLMNQEKQTGESWRWVTVPGVDGKFRLNTIVGMYYHPSRSV